MRETASAGEADCHQCRVATTVATDRRCVIGKQIEREAEGRRSRLPSMLGGHGDGTKQASCDREADREGAAREGEADYRRCQVAAATDRHRRLGVADRCRRQVAPGRSVDVKWPQGVGRLGRVTSHRNGDGTRLRGSGLEEIAVDVDGEWLGRRQFYFSWGSWEALMRSA